jgi:hypothetical protein
MLDKIIAVSGLLVWVGVMVIIAVTFDESLKLWY